MCFVALVVLVPQPASAQTTSTQTCANVSLTVNPNVPRYPDSNPSDNPNDLFPSRAQNLDPNAINYSDCKADIHLGFNVTVSGLPCTDTMQVWAGTTDCTQVSARQANSGATHCWPVLQTSPLTQGFTVNIRAQDLVAFISNSEPPSVYTPQGATACQSQAAPGVVSLGVYFMAMEADGLTVDGTPAMYSLDAALVGPYPPSNVVAGVGENLIVVSWTPATDSTIQGFNVYCQDQGASGGDAGLSDAGVPPATLVCPDSGAASDDSGDEASTAQDMGACVPTNVTGTAGAGGASCVSDDLVNSYCLVNGVASTSCVSTSATEGASEAGIISPVVLSDADIGEASVPAGTAVGISTIPSTFLCGQVGGNTTSNLIVKGFTNGGTGIQDFTQYAVGVAAFDGVGNVGLISNLSCVTPAPVITFWDQYVKDGGLAGGGFCALEGPGVPVSGSLFGIGMGAAAIAYVRRRRRSR